MATFCIPRPSVEKMRKALLDGVLMPDRLVGMSSAERVALFERVLGDATLARETNVLFESKLVLKNQQQGLKNWVAKVTDLNGKPAAKRDIINKIDRIEKVLEADSKQAFLRDLAEQRLGFRVTFEEAQIITKTIQGIKEAEAKITPDMPINAPERLAYGVRAYQLKRLREKLQRDDVSVKEWLTSSDLILNDTAGTLKSIAASFDNSFFGRQGLQALVESPSIWFRNYLKSWSDIGKELRGKDGMMLAEADTFSRPNALNGTYERMGLDIGISFEEAFPSAILSKIPGLGRGYKASETAFTAGALRMRADLADLLIEQMKGTGIDVMNKADMRPIGELINTLTGRGTIKGSGHLTNILFFSPRWMKSRVDALIAPARYGMMKGGQMAGKQYTPAEIFVRQKAAMNTVKLLGTMATVLFLAEQLHPGSVNFDPRTSDFGKIKIGNTRFDISAGLGSFITLAARMVPTKHNGDWGWWALNSKGQYRKISDIKSGKGLDIFQIEGESFGRTTLSYLGDFLVNKASPFMSPFVMIGRGSTFEGDPVTAPGLVSRLALPIPIQTYFDLQQEGAADTLWAMLMEINGIGTSTY